MAKFRIACMSDTHGMHRNLQVPQADILVHSGDFMVHGREAEEICDLNDWLGTLPHKYKIVVAGNHDRLFEYEPSRARDLLSNAIYLENSGIELDGLRIWGSPMQPQAMGWSFFAERGAAIRPYWNRMPANIDILVTHTPPFGTLDQAYVITPHLGCEELIKAVIRVKPKLHIFGHVHGGYGQVAGMNRTVFVNGAVVDEDYKLANDPWLIELDL